MSAYEWVIEQESPDGVTTRIVFDFADDDDNEGDSDGGLHRSGRGSNNNGNRFRGSSSSHHRTRGGRGGRSHSSAYGQSQTALQAQLQQQQPQQQQQQAGGVNLFYTQKDVTTRSEGGSSKRSSKRSNGSRTRRHRHHHASNGSGTSMSNSGMLTPAGSAYTSAALRQRYHRMLFGERGGSGNGSSRFDPTSNNVNTINFYTRAAAPTISNTSATGYSSPSPPSTLFLSTYGAELAEEEDQSSGSYPPRRSRTSTNSSSSNTNQNNHTNSSGATNPDNATAAAAAASAYLFAPSNQLSGEPGLNAPWAAYTAATALSPTTAEPPVFAPSSLLPHTTAESPPVRPSLPLSETSAHDYVDDDDRYCHYVKRDVWAARATCPRTVIASPTVFPAFPPLHPIPLEEESEWAKQQGRNAPGEAAQLGLYEVHKNMSDDDDSTANELLKSARHGPMSPVPFAVAASAQQQQQQFRVVSSLPDGFDQISGGLHNAFAHRDNEAQLLQRTAAEASADEAQRYNKMLLRKERQRGRGRSRGWQTTTATAGSSCSGADGYAGRGRGSGSQASAVAARRSRHHRCTGCCSSSSSTPSSCASDDDADFEVDSDDESSLECLSNTSSSDTDSDAEALRADVSFSAKVQSLATRAGRERRKMEAREERQLENELARCEEALMTPPLAAVPLPDSPTSPTSPITATASSFAPPPGPATLAAALRQRDNAFTAAGARAMGNGSSTLSTTSSVFTTSNTRYNTCTSATGGSISSHSSSNSAGNSRTPSSFFISPIHQSVAAESASWAAGTQIQFLGQGGLGGGSGGGNSVSGATYRLGNDDRTYKPHHTRSVNVNGGGGGGGGGYAGGLSRRRARADDDDDEERDEEARGAEGSHHAEHDAPAVAGSGAPKPETAALSKSQARRARKLRKKGDTAQQSVVPECGGSRALRPVAPPSLEPPMELLPCSKKEMCEDMLESFLMAAVLDDGDDLKLL